MLAYLAYGIESAQDNGKHTADKLQLMTGHHTPKDHAAWHSAIFATADANVDILKGPMMKPDAVRDWEFANIPHDAALFIIAAPQETNDFIHVQVGMVVHDDQSRRGHLYAEGLGTFLLASRGCIPIWQAGHHLMLILSPYRHPCWRLCLHGGCYVLIHRLANVFTGFCWGLHSA